MTDFRITTAGRYRRRNRSVAYIRKRKDYTSYPWEDEHGSTYTNDGKMHRGMSHGRDSFDIVKKLPDEDAIPLPTFSELRHANLDDAQPTAIASDGKPYPVDWFCVQQSFDEHMPPTLPNLRIFYKKIFLGGYYHFDDKNNVYKNEEFFSRGEAFLNSNSFWTLAPIPAPEKQESQIWDKYVSDYGTFHTLGIRMTVGFVKTHSGKIDALHAWKNHILSQDKGEG